MPTTNPKLNFQMAVAAWLTVNFLKLANSVSNEATYTHNMTATVYS